MEGRRPGANGEGDRRLTFRHVAETALHEWGLPWRTIERTWTDEQLYVTFAAMQDRLTREAERDAHLYALALGRPLLPSPAGTAAQPQAPKPAPRLGEITETYD